ncbi:GNAT family N-acetyltransferase [bacterium]|nr:GNAT family N-acetyltransferase [bacterium]
MGPSDLALMIELGLPTCGFMHGRKNVSEDKLRKNFTGFVKEFALEPNNEIYMIEHESGEIAGQIWLHTTQNRFNGLKEMWIWDITVVESYRRKGIGRHLMRLAEQRAVEQQCEELWLLVSERNDEARTLYRDFQLGDSARLLMKPLSKEHHENNTDERKIVVSGAELGRLRGSDLNGVIEVWNECEYIRYRPEGRDNPDKLRDYLDSPHPQAWGVWQQGLLVGVVTTTYGRQKGWIERLGIRPKYRRAGLAKVLVTSATQSLREMGAVVIAGLIEHDNLPSQLLFESCGFMKQPEHYYYAFRVGHEY